jgi:hypothetical protein
MTKNYIGLHARVKYRSFLSAFNKTWIRKILNYEISWQSHQWMSSCIMIDRETDIHDEAFRCFANASKNNFSFS